MGEAQREEGSLSEAHRRWLLGVLAPGVIVLAGVALRTAEYLHDKAIWLDEAFLSLNILQRGYADLLKPLDFNQGAPPGFLFFERFMADAFGPGEYALRFGPYLASVAALFLFWVFLRRWVSREALPVALALFALSPPLIRYACEVKQYAGDVAVTLALAGLATRWLERPTFARGLLLGVAGAVSIWCAFPAVFVLGGAGVTLAAASCRGRQWGRLAILGAAAFLWAASFAFYYQTVLRSLSGNAELRAWWSHAFMPLPPHSAGDVMWFMRAFFSFFEDPAGIATAGIGGLAFLLGALSMLFRDRVRLLLLLSPLMLALLASGLERYPFTGRFLLFAVPLILPLVAEGLEVVRTRSRTPLIYALTLLVLFAQPAVAGARLLVKPETPQGVRPAYQYLRAHYQPGDTLYLYYWAQFPFRYGMLRDGVDMPYRAGVTSRGDWSWYVDDMTRLLGKRRVWLVFVNTPKVLVGEEEKFFVTWLDTQGMRTDEFHARESSVYRYDLTGARVPLDKDD